MLGGIFELQCIGLERGSASWASFATEGLVILMMVVVFGWYCVSTSLDDGMIRSEQIFAEWIHSG
jgi:hypothetical protein